ncbi:MAG: hypothetical protein L6Q76_12860 [Polyangiaceae bacterium]|nr:hypothetical protein [Polyangiaceae bacterium]
MKGDCVSDKELSALSRRGRRRFFAGFCALCIGAVSLAISGCEGGGGGPRALILADASGSGLAASIDARAAAFKEQHGRAVRVLRVASGEAAVELAARGEADVAVVPEATSIDRFVSAEQGAQAGEITHGGARFRVLAVNPKQLPKADPQGAALAAFLAGGLPQGGASTAK